MQFDYQEYFIEPPQINCYFRGICPYMLMQFKDLFSIHILPMMPRFYCFSVLFCDLALSNNRFSVHKLIVHTQIGLNCVVQV